MLVKAPQTATHEKVLSILDRYSEALPGTEDMIPIKAYITKRKDALRLLENQPHYTKQTLLEIAATILDESDGREVDDYISNKQTHVGLKDYAQEKIQKNYLRNIKLTSKNPEDHAVPLPVNNRKRQHMHAFAVSGQRIPQELLVSKKKNKPNGRGGGRNGRSDRNQQNSNQNGQKKENNQSQRGKGNRAGRGGRNGNRGGRAPAAVKETTATPNNTNDQSSNCESIFDTYDLSKIPQKVSHFGQITPDMHDLLQAQLTQRNIEIRAPKK